MQFNYFFSIIKRDNNFNISQETYKCHPLKRIKIQTASVSFSTLPIIISSSDESKESVDASVEFKIAKSCTSTDLAVKVHHQANLSLSQTVKVLKILHTELNDDRLTLPSRTGLYKASKRFQQSSINLDGGNILQFDGKTFTNLYGNRKIQSLAICFAGKLIAIKELPNNNNS